MRDRHQIMSRGVGGNLEDLGQTAGPIYIGLQHVQAPGVDIRLHAPARVVVFAPCQRHGRAPLDPAVAADAVGHHALLQPARPELGDAVEQVQRVANVERLPAIEHQVVTVAERLAQRPHQGDVLPQALAPAAGSVAEEPLLGAEATSLQHKRALPHQAHVEHVVAERGHVSGHAVPRRPAQQAMHRLAEPAPLQVPQRAIHRTHRHHRHTVPAVRLRPVHLVPQRLMRDRVAAQQHRPHARHHLCDAVLDRPGPARDAIIRADLEKDLLRAEMPLVDLPAAPVPA